jgi:hypothetical protein
MISLIMAPEANELQKQIYDNPCARSPKLTQENKDKCFSYTKIYTSIANFKMGTRGNARKGKAKERWIDGVRRSMTNHGLTVEDTRDRDRWRNLVLGEGKTTVEWTNLR